MWNDRYSGEGLRQRMVGDPITLGLSAATIASLSTAATVAGGVTAAAGAGVAAVGSYNAYSYKAAVAKNNAAIARENATYSLTSGDIQARNQGLKDRFQLANILTKQSGAGLDVNTGSALATRESQGWANIKNQEMIRANAQRKAYGYGIEEQNALAESRADKSAGTNALVAGGLNVLGSLVGTAGSVSDKWMKFGRMGVEGYKEFAPSDSGSDYLDI